MDRRTWKEPVDERIVVEGVFLEHGAVLRITNGSGLLVTAHVGTLWITEQGDRRDVIVTGSRSYRIESDGLAIVNALQGASVTISAPLGIPARWTVEGAASGGLLNGVRIQPRKRGGRTGRDLWAWVLRCYRSGARVARAAQLDARTRRDIGLEPFHSTSPAERAEQYRWSHDYAWPARESRFI